MNQNKIVTVNGHRYDAHTGLLVDPANTDQPSVKKPTLASSIHSTTQRSKTLVRRAIKKPLKPTISTISRPVRQTMDIARSSKISRFAPTSSDAIVRNTPKTESSKNVDIPATNHPAVSRAIVKTKKSEIVALAPKTTKEVKDEAIANALNKPTTKNQKMSTKKRRSRFLTIASLCLLIVVLASYITYINMPNLSVAVAASQAGISAKYPDYRPDGYSVNGPVTFNDSEASVTINFRANSGTSKFTFKQARSSWDSSAVLDNIVRKKVGEQYITSQVGGLTIYSYNGNAAWVNAGILYTIDGNAPLSSDQIRRIATSL